jgi:hypothetical protein
VLGRFPDFAKVERTRVDVQSVDHPQLAVLKMEGYTVEEIGVLIDRVARTVKRKLKLIRLIWEKELSARIWPDWED